MQLAAVNMTISSEIKFQRLAANLFRAEHDEVQNYITFNVLESVLRIRIRFISWKITMLLSTIARRLKR